jgi:hypothetical protein
MKAEDQAEALRAIVKLSVDPKELDKLNDADYATRTGLNAHARQLRAEAASIPIQEGLPKTKVDEEEIRERKRLANEANKNIMAQIEERLRLGNEQRDAEEAVMAHQALIARKSSEIQALEDVQPKLRLALEKTTEFEDFLRRGQNYFAAEDFADSRQMRLAIDRATEEVSAFVSRTFAQIEETKTALEQARSVQQAALQQEKGVQEALAEAIVAYEHAPSGQMMDMTALDEELERARLINREIDKRERREELKLQAAAIEEEKASLTRRMDDREEQKRKAISEAKMPIDGMSFTESQVLYKGIPIKQLGEARQIMLGVSIAIARNPKLRLVLIPHGEALDDDTLAELEAMAKEKDFYVWMAKVDGSGNVGIYLEDGQVIREND